MMKETHGFASLPHGRFAFIGAALAQKDQIASRRTNNDDLDSTSSWSFVKLILALHETFRWKSVWRGESALESD